MSQDLCGNATPWSESVQPATRDSRLLGILLRYEYPSLKQGNRLVPSGTPLVGPVAYQCTTTIEALISKLQLDVFASSIANAARLAIADITLSL